MFAQVNFQPIPASALMDDSRVRRVEAYSLEDVLPALAEVDRLCREEGKWAIGFVSYEAAPAFEPRFEVRRGQSPVPLLAFLVGAPQQPVITPGHNACNFRPQAWEPGMTRQEYIRAFEQIRQKLYDGETYQVNFTFPFTAESTMKPDQLYALHLASAASRYLFYWETESYSIISLSPELFFRTAGGRIITKPMKGTRPRGWSFERDQQLAQELQKDPKERAENVMIVDLLRNDLGRIAVAGSVQVSEMFAIERYPSVLQMTSTVEARLPEHVRLPEIFQALFPCGSVTGAPKVKTMEIIRELENYGRGVYCGACGCVMPGGDALFNVAIRTLTCLKREDSHTWTMIYPVGSGVTISARAEEEYNECLLKAQNLAQVPPAFSLLETLLWEPGEGWFLLDRHMARLRQSAYYFAFPYDELAIKDELTKCSRQWDRPHRVRILVHDDGSWEIQTAEIDPGDNPVRRVGLVRSRQSTRTPWHSNKTTFRRHYERARAIYPEADDVILINPEGFVTESTIANVAVQIDGVWYTPPLEDGLLPGTMRQHLLDAGQLVCRRLTPQDLFQAEAVMLMNSVRGSWQVSILPSIKELDD